MNISRKDDKEYVIRVIQDLRVKARDVDDFMEKKRLQKIIEKMEKGFNEEYKDFQFT